VSSNAPIIWIFPASGTVFIQGSELVVSPTFSNLQRPSFRLTQVNASYQSFPWRTKLIPHIPLWSCKGKSEFFGIRKIAKLKSGSSNISVQITGRGFPPACRYPFQRLVGGSEQPISLLFKSWHMFSKSCKSLSERVLPRFSKRNAQILSKVEFWIFCLHDVRTLLRIIGFNKYRFASLHKMVDSWCTHLLALIQNICARKISTSADLTNDNFLYRMAFSA